MSEANHTYCVMYTQVNLYFHVIKTLLCCIYVYINLIYQPCACIILKTECTVLCVSRPALASNDVAPTSKYYNTQLDGG